MTVEKGQILTPEKKYLLIDEIRQELSKHTGALVIKGNDGKSKDIQAELKLLLEKLINKKGVVTPNETDEILDKINEAKRIRLGSDYSSSLKRAGLIVGVFFIVAIGGYYFSKMKP